MMQRNIHEKVGAIVREVRSCEHDGKPAHAVIATRVYDTDADDLWDAITNPERLPRWFLPVSGDLRLGGTYQLKGNAGGTITRCEPPRTLALTWEFGGEVSWVYVDLNGKDDEETELVLKHIALVDKDRWDQYGPAVGVGWDLTLFGLAEHLSTKAGVSPENADEWLASSDGKGFIRASSEAWRQASVKGGTPADKAEAAAKRTTAFYTGETENE